MRERLAQETERARRWGVILAGRGGTRLRSHTGALYGDDRRRRFCRTERNIPADQTLYALTRNHRDFYAADLKDVSAQWIVQPQNKGTAPPILFAVLSIARSNRDGLVAVLPCHRHDSDEHRFSAALESAFEHADLHRGSVILLGAPITRAGLEYGWIELGPRVGGDESRLFGVRRFCEGPSLGSARRLQRLAAVRNTFVMVGHINAFLAIIQSAVPDLFRKFAEARVWRRNGVAIEDSLYENMSPVDFSRQVLAVEAKRLLVLRMSDVGWSDLCKPAGLLSVLHQTA